MGDRYRLRISLYLRVFVVSVTEQQGTNLLSKMGYYFVATGRRVASKPEPRWEIGRRTGLSRPSEDSSTPERHGGKTGMSGLFRRADAAERGKSRKALHLGLGQGNGPRYRPPPGGVAARDSQGTYRKAKSVG